MRHWYPLSSQSFCELSVNLWLDGETSRRGGKKKVSCVLFWKKLCEISYGVPTCGSSRRIHSSGTVLTWDGVVPEGALDIAERHFRLSHAGFGERVLLAPGGGHLAGDAAKIPDNPQAQTWPRMSMSIALRLRNTAPNRRLNRWWFYTADCQQVSPQPLFYQQRCQRESINPRNIWNEIPTAKLLWKAVTCWWAEAYATKIDQLHKLSIALKEFILLVWTSVAVLSKSKTQMVPRVAKLGKKI